MITGGVLLGAGAITALVICPYLAAGAAAAQAELTAVTGFTALASTGSAAVASEAAVVAAASTTAGGTLFGVGVWVGDQWCDHKIRIEEVQQRINNLELKLADRI